MKVWRIEHKDSGLGPWYHDFDSEGIEAFCTVLTDTNYDRLYPGYHNKPSIDKGELAPAFIAGKTNGWYYGFKTLAMVKQWFNSKAGRKAMAQIGFVLRQYQVDRANVLLGNTQLAFNRKRATLLQERALT